MVSSYKLPGLEAMTLPLEISATTEEVKEYLRDQHMINRRFNVRIYVQGKAVYLAKEKTLEQCGVKPDSTMAVLYADPAEKKRERRLQAKDTSGGTRAAAAGAAAAAAAAAAATSGGTSAKGQRGKRRRENGELVAIKMIKTEAEERWAKQDAL